MKKIILFLIVVVALIFIADKIYKIYSRHNVNAHEAVILINDCLMKEDVDAFFGLDTGTYDASRHKIVYSLTKKEAYVLDAYIDLPVKYKYALNSDEFTCNIDYAEIEHYGFYNYELGNSNIIARIIVKDASAIRRLGAEQIISQKFLDAQYEYGKINVLSIGKIGVRNACK